MSSAQVTPEATIVLKDGSTVAVRSLRPEDEGALAGFYGALSPESQGFRFFAAPADVGELAKRLVISNYESQFGLIALASGEIVGHAVYIVTGGRRAAFTSVRDIPGEVDLAVIASNAPAAVEAAADCAAKHVHAAVVISPGFAESGAEGAELQRRLVEICRQSGMRLVGPNCSGVLNTSDGVRLNASVIANLPAAG